jgi:LuxR family maltose regulon positive regulatory protein
MGTPLLHAKIRVPKPQNNLISRPLLVLRLGKALSTPLVLISAPAGFGKTSLAAQFIAELGRTNTTASRTSTDSGGSMLPAWVSLEAEDDDPIRFWSLVAASFERAFQTLEEHSISSPFASISAAAQSLQPPNELELASALIDGVLSTGASFLFVLDDFHRLHAERIMASFTRFLESLPEQIRVIILSRTDPPLPLARFRARGLMTEFRAQELRFDPAEARAILQEALGDSLLDRHAQVIEDKTEGWGAGLRLAALSLQRRSDRDAFIKDFSGNNRLILEFLTEEVLAVQPEEIKAFLLASAVLDRFCADLCDDLLEANFLSPGLSPGRLPSSAVQARRAGELLHRVEAENLFLVPLDDEGVWYRYHHLFAHTLRARLRVLDPGAEQKILGLAASWHEARGELEIAMGLQLRAGCRPEAARLLEGIDYFARGEMGTLVSRLNELGEETLFSRPRLMDLPGWTKAFAGKFSEAMAYITKARSRLEGLDDAGRRYVQGSFASLEAFMGFLKGDLIVAIQKAREADSLLEPDAYYPRSIIPYVQGSVHRMEGWFEQARSAFNQLEAIGQSRGSIWTISAARYEVAITHYFVGELSQAAEILSSALADADARGAGRFASLAKLRALHADILYERGQWDLAEQQVAMMMESAEIGGVAPSLLELYAARIRLLLGYGRVGDTQVFFDKARNIMDSGGALTRTITDMNDLAYRASLLSGMARRTDHAVQRPAQDCITERIAQCTDIQESLFHGDFEVAHRRASELTTAAKEGDWGAFYVKSMILDSRALLGLRKEQQARKALETALRFGHPRGFLRVFIDYGGVSLVEELRHLQSTSAEMKHLCGAVLAAAQGTTTDQVAGIVSAREREVLSLLVQGLSNRDIADRLFISESTVKTHLYHLSAKWQVPNRVAVLAKARSLGIV